MFGGARVAAAALPAVDGAAISNGLEVSTFLYAATCTDQPSDVPPVKTEPAEVEGFDSLAPAILYHTSIMRSSVPISCRVLLPRCVQSPGGVIVSFVPAVPQGLPTIISNNKSPT